MGIVFDIQRCCYFDGPGIRTTVFFKGCNLHCDWCHNPESFSFFPQLKYVSSSCIACHKCASVCSFDVHRFYSDLPDHIHSINFNNCTACGKCISICPTNALSLIGKEMSIESIMDIVRKDLSYYHTSGGGLTISGGEPTMQPRFLKELLYTAHHEQIHTCIESNGYIKTETLMDILPFTDLFLIDFKLEGAEEKKMYLHTSENLWENTLQILSAYRKPVILRMPVIPGINDTCEHFKTAALYRKRFSCIQKIEIMPYHTIGVQKWLQLGMSYPLPDISPVTPEQKQLWEQQLQQYCLE